MKQPALVINAPRLWDFGEVLTNGGSYNNYVMKSVFDKVDEYIKAAGVEYITVKAAREAIYMDIIADLYRRNYLTAESYMELVERLK